MWGRKKQRKSRRVGPGMPTRQDLSVLLWLCPARVGHLPSAEDGCIWAGQEDQASLVPSAGSHTCPALELQGDTVLSTSLGVRGRSDRPVGGEGGVCLPQTQVTHPLWEHKMYTLGSEFLD